jgi:hypothetical protein
MCRQICVASERKEKPGYPSPFVRYLPKHGWLTFTETMRLSSFHDAKNNKSKISTKECPDLHCLGNASGGHVSGGGKRR